jgi:hypothetical protein
MKNEKCRMQKGLTLRLASVTRGHLHFSTSIFHFC